MEKVVWIQTKSLGNKSSWDRLGVTRHSLFEIVGSVLVPVEPRTIIDWNISVADDVAGHRNEASCYSYKQVSLLRFRSFHFLKLTLSEVYTFWSLHFLKFKFSEVYTFWSFHFLKLTLSEVYTFWSLHFLKFKFSEVYTFWGLHFLKFTLSEVNTL